VPYVGGNQLSGLWLDQNHVHTG